MQELWPSFRQNAQEDFAYFVMQFIKKCDKMKTDRVVKCEERQRYYMAGEREEAAYRQQVVNEYKSDVQKLLRYLPWLEEKVSQNVSENFEGAGITESSISFPVYDGTLMSFVKEVQRTNLLDRNYVYVYSRHQIRTVNDELRIIGRCGITEMDVLKGILSKYIMGGMTKGRLWSDAVRDGIFLNIIKKMKENLEFWDKPMMES